MFGLLQAVQTVLLRTFMCLVVIVSALEMTGITVVLSLQVRRTWRSRSSSRPPRTRAAGKFLLPFAWPLRGGSLGGRDVSVEACGSEDEEHGVDVGILHARRSHHLHLLGEGLLELALEEA